MKQIMISLDEPSLEALKKLAEITGKTKSHCLRDLIPGVPIIAALVDYWTQFGGQEIFEDISLDPIRNVTQWLITQMTVACEEQHKIDCQVRILCEGYGRANATGKLYARWIRAVMGTEDYFFEQVATEDGRHWAYFVRGPEDDEGYLRLLRQNMIRKLQKDSDQYRQIIDTFRKQGIPVKDYPAKEVEGTESDE